MVKWEKIQKVVNKYPLNIREQDREDLKQDIILAIAEEWDKQGVVSESRMLTIGESITKRYQRAYRKQFDSLDVDIKINGEGSIPLIDTIPAENPDIQSRLEAKEMLEKLPQRLIKIGQRRADGYPLSRRDQNYLERWRKKIRENAL